MNRFPCSLQPIASSSAFVLKWPESLVMLNKPCLKLMLQWFSSGLRSSTKTPKRAYIDLLSSASLALENVGALHVLGLIFATFAGESRYFADGLLRSSTS